MRSQTVLWLLFRPLKFSPIFKSFTFDDFASADFSQGFLELTIANSMVIPIGSPIVIELLQVTLDDTINIPGASFQFDNIIDANNGSSTGIIDLTNISLPGEIESFWQLSGERLE